MISYYDGQLIDIMPENIAKNPEVKALSYALQQACRLLYRYSQRLYIYSNLDEQPEEVIDLLASELRTQYYRSTLDIDTKRRLVKNTLIWYMSAGTPQAVEELIELVFGRGSVKEWWEYGGEPYYFRVRAEAPLTEAAVDKFTRIIQDVKNTRSHLEAIEVFRQLNQKTYIGSEINWKFKRQTIEDTFTGIQLIAQSLIYAAETKTIGRLVIREKEEEI